MASIILDLTLCEWESFEPTEPGTPERTTILTQILAAAGCEGWVDAKVLQEHGPGGGNPEVEFSGSRDDIAKVVAWTIAEMGESDEWADEYWTDRS